MKAIDGSSRSLASYKGKALLIVNTASKCGFTPQYESLEALYDKYKGRGFEVLAFPANDFMNQEPGSDAEIQKFCTLKYDTSFPLFSKIHVKGKEIAPLYTYLTKESAFPGDIEWNFTKFLIGPDGQVVARFGSRVDPMSKDVTGKLEALLAQK
jgi:glutathione peroxidase